MPQAIRVPMKDLSSFWFVNSERQAWHPRLVALWKDGGAICSCERGPKGCTHIETAKAQEAAEFAAEETLAEARIDEARSA